MNLKYIYELSFLVKLITLTCFKISGVITKIFVMLGSNVQKKSRAEQKAASIGTKTEQKRELRNLKCSVLRQNNHSYQIPFVVNILFFMVDSYKEANACERFVSLVTDVPCKAIMSHSHACPCRTSLQQLFETKNWLSL